MLVQGVSGLAGFPWTLAVDAGVIPTLYMPMYSELRAVFGRFTRQNDKMTELIIEIAPEIVSDILFDKIAGQIPLIGVYFNAICAKSMTWRLGILFAMLSARGEMISSEKISESMELIRASFPQKNFWQFTRPTFKEFERLCAQFQDISQEEYNRRVEHKLKGMKVADF